MLWTHWCAGYDRGGGSYGGGDRGGGSYGGGQWMARFCGITAS
jgi:hypothetical protein